MVTVILDEADQPLGEAWVELMGLPEIGKGERPLAETLETELTEFLDGADKKMLANDDKLDEAHAQDRAAGGDGRNRQEARSHGCGQPSGGGIGRTPLRNKEKASSMSGALCCMFWQVTISLRCRSPGLLRPHRRWQP